MSPNELYDIALPLAPGFDWLFWVSVSVGLLLGLLLLVLVVVLLRHWVLPLKILWLNKRLMHGAMNPSDHEFKRHVFQTYQICQGYWQRHMGMPQQDFQLFRALVNQTCFSLEQVPRETFTTLLAALNEQVRQQMRQQVVSGIRFLHPFERGRLAMAWAARYLSTLRKSS